MSPSKFKKNSYKVPYSYSKVLYCTCERHTVRKRVQFTRCESFKNSRCHGGAFSSLSITRFVLSRIPKKCFSPSSLPFPYTHCSRNMTTKGGGGRGRRRKDEKALFSRVGGKARRIPISLLPFLENMRAGTVIYFPLSPSPVATKRRRRRRRLGREEGKRERMGRLASMSPREKSVGFYKCFSEIL